MTIHLPLQFQQVVDLVDQLSEQEQQILIQRLLARNTEMSPLTPAEKIRLFDASKLHNRVLETPSPRRADWYNDDGR
jgi:hypothetical protein